MAEILPDSLVREVGALGTEGKRALVARLRSMIAQEMSPSEAVPQACPRCGCPEFVRKGHASDGSQRWLCRGCGSTFGVRTRSVVGQSRLPEETWLSYAEGMADGLTLEQLAARRGVRLKTSWCMRMRLCEAMAARLDAFRSGPGVSVEADGTMLRESFGGNAPRGTFSMPRKPRRTYRDLHVRGVSGQLACVVCAANDRGDALCGPVGRAHGTSEAIRPALRGAVAPGTALATDDLPAYGRVATALGAEHEVRPARGRAQLGMVNALHKRLADFLRPFNGVATRRLQRYLDWFCWTEQFRRGDADRRELACREARSGAYRTTVRDIFTEPRLFMEYWEDRAVSTVV